MTEILSLARHFIKLSDEQLKTGSKELSGDVEEYLLTHWRGSERELESAVKKACILSQCPVLEIEDFDIKKRQARSIGEFIEERLRRFIQNINRLEKFNLYDTVIPEVEKALITMVLKETKGNQIKASKLLGINRNTLREKIKKLKIDLRVLKA
ncbi:MAG: hypothetical protein HY752_05335 [Nitrospirae bacterium]|nr:hypothetical protein [Nitrospirota bacterium]